MAERATLQEALERTAREHLPHLLSGSDATLGQFSLIALQGFSFELTRPSFERKERFRAHLLTLLRDSVMAADSLADESAREPSRLLTASCRVCRGLCCRHAGDEAHLDAAPLQRLRTRNPELTDAEIIALYTNAIPELTVERSCIAHGELGCALPRELRSQTCNEFYCVPIQEWDARERAGRPPRPTAVVVVQDNRVLRAELLRE